MKGGDYTGNHGPRLWQSFVSGGKRCAGPVFFSRMSCKIHKCFRHGTKIRKQEMEIIYRTVICMPLLDLK